jgi:hypothetical protein
MTIIIRTKTNMNQRPSPLRDLVGTAIEEEGAVVEGVVDGAITTKP